MAAVPPIKVPVEVLGLKCLFCVDKVLGSDNPAEPNDAITLAPWAQVFSIAGQNIVGCTAVPVCETCRAEQIAAVEAVEAYWNATSNDD